jgi:hypothetical protein
VHRADAAQHVQPVKLRHIHVEKYKIGAMLLDIHQTLQAVLRLGHHLDALGHQQGAQKSAQAGILVHDDATLGRRIRLPGSRRVGCSRPLNDAHLLQRGQNAVGTQGLRHRTDGTKLERLLRHRLCLLVADDDHRCRQLRLMQRHHEIERGHVRDGQIQDHHIGLQLLDQGQRRLAFGRLANHDVAVGLDDGAQRRAH